MEVLFQNLHIKEELEIFDIEVEHLDEKPFLGFDDSETDVKLPLFYKGLLNCRVTAELVPLISDLLENYSAQFDEVDNTKIIKEELVEKPNQVSKGVDHKTTTGPSLDVLFPDVYEISKVKNEFSGSQECFKTIHTVVEELLPAVNSESNNLFPGTLNDKQNQSYAIQPHLKNDKNFTFDASSWNTNKLKNYTYCGKVLCPDTVRDSQNSPSLGTVHFAQIKGFQELNFSKKYLRFYTQKIVKLYIARSLKNKTVMARRKKFFLERKPPFAKAMKWRRAYSHLLNRNENIEHLSTTPGKVCENDTSYMSNSHLSLNRNNQNQPMVTFENVIKQNSNVVTVDTNEINSHQNNGTTTLNTITTSKLYQNIFSDKDQNKCVSKQMSVGNKSDVTVNLLHRENADTTGHSVDCCINHFTLLENKCPVILLSKCDDKNLNTSTNVQRTNDHERENLQEQLQETVDCNSINSECIEENTEMNSVDFIHDLLKDQNKLKYKKNKQQHSHRKDDNNSSTQITDKLPVNEIVFKKCNRHTNSKEVHTCSICLYSCESLNEFEIHLKTHNDNNAHFSCDYCDVSCSSQSSLSRHKLLKHSAKKRYECKLCNFKCAIPQYLQSHFQVHTSFRAFECNMCSFRAKTASNLSNHIRRHKKIKPFACSFCDYRCDNRSLLKVHNFIHTGETEHVCKICPYKAATGYALKRHMKVHSNTQ